MITGPSNLPSVVIVEEGMREGMQIESATICVSDKIRLLNELSATGLEKIVVGSFVSPKWVPQMADIEEIIAGFTPVDSVEYTALVLNDRGAERRRQFSPPLTIDSHIGRTSVHLCDVFVKRNTARGQQDEIDRWDTTIASAVARGVTEATVAINAAWGSNWLGEFSADQRLDFIGQQVRAWSTAGIVPTRLWIGDPMSWNTPRAVEETLRQVQVEWPSFTSFHLHLHDGRGMATLSAYQALRCLDESKTLVVDTSIGGMGGCPYCGNGRATRMIPTEDFVHLLESEGYETGIDLYRLIEVVHLAESIVGHQLYGRVSHAGPRPTRDRLYDMDMPLIETFDEAQHFRLGAGVYANSPSPYKETVQSQAREEIERRMDASHD